MEANERTSNKNIKFGAVVSYLVIIINIICGLVFTPWLVRTIGQSQYGLYTLAISLINLFLIDFGISASISRFIAKYEAENRPEKVQEFVSLITRVYFIIDIIISVAFIFIAFNLEHIYKNLSVDELSVFRVIFIICAIYNVISFPITTLSTGFLNAYELFGIQKLCGVLSKIGQVVFSIIALKLGFGIYAVVIINALCGLLGTIAKLFFVYKKTPIKMKMVPIDKEMIGLVFSFTIWTAITGIAERLTYNIQPSILGVTAGSTEIAVFGAASSLESYIYTFTTAINGLFLPRISRILADNDEKKLLGLMISVGKIQYIITGWIFVGFICVGEAFIVLWLGNEYVTAYLCTILMVLPCLFTRPQQIGNTTLIAKGKVRELAFIDIAMIATTIVVSIVLSPSLGSIGVAIAICVGNIVDGLLRCLAFKKLLNIRLSLFIKECYLRVGIPISISIIIALLLRNSLAAVNLRNLCLGGVLITIIYFILVGLIALSKSEKGRLWSTLRRR